MTITAFISFPVPTFRQAPDEEVKAAVQWALEIGYRHIDTAYNYQNEGAIGEVIQEWILSGKLKREELFVTTKVSLNVKKNHNSNIIINIIVIRPL